MSRALSNVPGSDSPLKANLVVKAAHSNAKLTRKENHRELRRDMLHVSLVVEPEKFLELFLPEETTHSHNTRKKSPRKPSNPFVNMKKPTSERKMYEDYPKALNQIIQGSDYTFVATPYKADNATSPKLAVDCGMYPHDRVPKNDLTKGIDASKRKDFRRVCWSGIDLPAECKLEDDPFEDGVDTGRPSSDKRRDASGQAMSYIELTFHHQNRTFVFMLIFIGLNCRLLRVDRSGLFVTKRFNITNTDFLVEFLRRYVKLSPEARGIDTTAERIDPSGSVLAGMMKERLAEVEKTLEEQKALESGEGNAPDEVGNKDRVEEHIVELWRKALNEKWPWWKLRVPDEVTEKDRWFLVGKPSFQAPGIRGRGTRCYIAVELLEREHQWELDTKFVYLKDCWRVLDGGADGPAMDIRQEGITLQKLNDAQVEHVPTLVAHGDIKDQTTQAPAAWKKVNDKHKCRLKTHRHYRLIVKEIGKPLSEFENSGQLLRVLYDCVRAHRDAMAIEIIHRDISGGNILLYKNEKGTWRGLLTDWELSKDTSIHSNPRQVGRTGTLQFSAARVLDNPSKMITATDEIECFFHVLIYYAVRFLHHNIPDESVGLFLQNYFDASAGMTSAGELNAPALKREAMLLGSIRLHSYGVFDRLQFKWVDNPPQGTAQGANPATRAPTYSHPLNKVVETLLSWFCGVYAVDFLDRPAAVIDAPSEGGSSPSPYHGQPAVADDSASDSESESEFEMEFPPALSPNDTIDPDRPSPEQEKMLRAMAAKLNGHAHVVALFRKSVRLSFPRDKTKDKRPEKGYEPHSPESPQFSEISDTSDVGLEPKGRLYQPQEGGAAPSDGPAPPENFAELAINQDSDGERGERLALPVLPTLGPDDIEYYDGCSRSPSPCPIRPKRGRQSDVAPSDLGTSGKRSRY
ncbi:hypothetical protein GSI_04063 [Ganoderma sinense ZZ0214-1]|uniref:Fungal-type protein kinase domain-containing protein n=1 Tax=Ganoderma sinense ZZ0214-1 TaxID=1077348 RepID=A0A2G8SI61_9APHY|nr:hypothetical protein GSI_04063 [Ganoderma sinense ZZ0214-1]